MPRKQVEVPKAKLGWLFDGEFRFEPHSGPNRLAADVTLTQLRGLHRVEPIDAALTTAFEMLAEAVDSDPTNAALWGQYRAVEESLRGLGGDADADSFEAWVAELSAAVVDAENKSTNPRSRRGQGGGGVGVPVDAVAAARGGRGKRGSV